MKYRNARFTPDFKLRVLLALDANLGNINETSLQFELPRKWLIEWDRNRELIVQEAREARDLKQLPLDVRLDLIKDELINSLPEKIRTTKLMDTLRAIAMIAQLRAQFEAEKPPDDVYEKLSNLVNRYREHVAAQSAINNHSPEPSP